MVQPSADRVITPEAVVLDFETAGLASRLFAGLIDVTVQFVLLLLLLLVALPVADLAGGTDRGTAAAAVYLGGFLIIFGYPVALESLWRGRTLGKAAMGLRAVTVTGLPMRFRHAAIRSMMGLVDKWMAAGSIGVLSVLLTRRNQRTGDLVAGTIVLRERRSTATAAPVAFAPPPGLEGYCATLDTAGLTQRDYVTIRSFLLRAHTLPAGPRAALARDLAVPLRQRLRVAVPDGLHPEVWLACLLAAQQAKAVPVTAQAHESVWSLSVPGAPPAVRWGPEPGRATPDGADGSPRTGADAGAGGFRPPG